MPEIDLKLEGVAEIDEHSPMWRRVVAVLAATVAFLGAIGAFLHERAEKAEELAAVEAQAAASKGLALSVSRTTEWTTNQRIATEYGLTQVRTFDARTEGDHDLESSLESVAADLYARTALLSNDTYRLDPNPSNRYVADRFLDVNRALFEQKAKSETAEAWHASAERYVAVLAIFAAALFLFGLAQITKVGRNIFVGFGLVAMLVAAGYMLNNALRHVPQTSAAALDALASAEQSRAAGDYAAAITFYDAAIAARHDYADAYLGRATARWQEAGRANPTEPYIEYIVGPPLDLALADTRSAVGYGATDKLALNQLAALLIHAEQYKNAKRILDRVLDLDDKLAVAWTNLGAVQVALGNGDEARGAYERAIELAGSEPSRYQRMSLYSAARAVLDEIGIHQPDQRDLANDLSAELTEAQADVDNSAAGHGDNTVEVSNVVAQGPFISETLTTTASDGVPVSIVGYFREQPDRPWHQPTTMVTFGRVLPAKPQQAAQQFSVWTGRDCSVPGYYRIDVVVDGHVTSSKELMVPEGAAGRLVYEKDLVAGASLCRPEAWTRSTDDTALAMNDVAGTSVVVGAGPLPPTDPSSGLTIADAEIGLLADANFTPVNTVDFTLGGRPGRIADTVNANGLHRFVFATQDGQLVRYVVATATKPEFTLVDQVLLTIRFW